ncbi:ABC transporter ATP-binding protein [Corynebacterium striatum]|uniref:ABC transporter ATP-binding protein n=1 Tax=Corynebacterium striatum TaxID=43770 RepID=UPI00062759BB|nr:ABC transporter ATP-binding protein [Corynebacterium striatum]KKO79798.1 ABC transporter ATP-binding protein [Corynebacterium striatum]MDK7883308.1 ABC transporter ATP-binding protein [Corynebacterium striatum]HCD2522809.1 ABC transporter ATP-binding protein [Corynebacterium striatum]HCD3162486.1 ABC transporter ATP-binding protein [Corynebacterium striatum]HCD3684955.1 ABC transporter ATP-binding protein [Corynebacterium striatum]
MSTEYVVETQGLTKEYKGFKAVDGLDMAIGHGVVHGLLGPNGSGKSTTMKMLLGLAKPTAGSISLFGEPFGPKTRSRALARTGSLIEQPSAYLHLTGRENLRIAARLLRAEAEDVDRAVHLVRLEKQLDKQVANYSLGMKQRLGIAMAMIRNPRLLILDEPTNGLDPAGIEEIRNLIVSLAADEGRTVLVSSHLLSEIEKMASELTIINRGQLLFQGTKQELFHSQPPEVYIETPNPKEAAQALAGISVRFVEGGIRVPNLSERDVAGACEQLVNHGVPIYQVLRTHRSLEEIFISITGRGGLQ